MSKTKNKKEISVEAVMTGKQKNFRILVSDALGPAGMKELKKQKGVIVDENSGLSVPELKKIIKQYDAIIIRSGTKLTADILEHATKLRVIGRAGVGVDNVDLKTATKLGIIVMNTPEGNTVSTAEHTFSMLMSVARKIPQAVKSLKGGEWKRHKFLGSELNNKVLGVIGFGRIGRVVSNRAAAFGMKVLVYDPFITADKVGDYPVEYAEFKDLVKRADFITVHTPLTPETKYLLNAKAFQNCKKGLRVVNCARGGIIEEKALLDALNSGKVAGAALDVFEKEPPDPKHPLLNHPNVICTPHLGAATAEAQQNVAVEVVKQVVDALHEHAIKNAVNLPNLDPESYKVLRPWISIAEKLGALQFQLFGGGLKKVTIRYGGEVERYSQTPLTLAVVKGLLAPICGDTVNFVNAVAMAKERGIELSESRSTQSEDFTHFIDVEVESQLTGSRSTVTNRVMGTIFDNHLPRVVRINEYLLDVDPTGVVIFIFNDDQPGVVGKVGTILGKNKINIAEMSLGRIRKGRKTLALTVINTDEGVPAKVLSQLKKFQPIRDVKVVKL